MKQNWRYNNFDLLRIMAALQVVFVHCVEHMGLEHGPVYNVITLIPGVPIFFVLSGFLVAASYERAPNLRSYFTYRFLRIYPALWVCLVVSTMTAVLAGVRFDAAEFIPWALAQASIVQFYNPDFLRGYGVGVINGSLWTITVELQFYLAVPFISMMLARARKPNAALLIGIAAFLILNRLFVEHTAHQRGFVEKLIEVTLFPYLYLFLVGVFLQRNMSLVRRFLFGKAWLWFPLFIVVTTAMDAAGLNVRGNHLHPISAVLLAFAAVSAAYTLPNLHKVLLGHDLSYGLYIYHMPFINLALALGLKSTGAAWACAAIALFTALASWRLVERPALGLKHRVASRLQRDRNGVVV